MNLYYFNPNTYGQNYTLMSDSKESALKVLVDYFKRLSEDRDNEYKDFALDDFLRWKNATVDTLPIEYTLEEHPANYVIRTETS